MKQRREGLGTPRFKCVSLSGAEGRAARSEGFQGRDIFDSLARTRVPVVVPAHRTLQLRSDVVDENPDNPVCRLL